MFWLYLAIGTIAGLAVVSILLLLVIRWLARREPYGTFIRLRTRRKLTFFRLMMSDQRVPGYVKAIPVVLVIYLSIPFDIIPDFIPVLGYLDDVALAILALVLVIRLTPWPVVSDLLDQARGPVEPPAA
jgi:uncharacterized membrane protein YkvA (DUF1232 family)